MAPNQTDTANPICSCHYMNWGNPALDYTFLFVDGLGGTNNPPESPITYHVGTNPYYTCVPVLSKNFTISGGQQTTLTLTADIQNVFYGSSTSTPINILNNPVTQTTDYPALAHTFINEFSQILVLQ